ncbi:MAG TPA: isoprenylcysteine carboxylmethyltransferase family protein [Chthoniobacterales bacterium]|nr:isoprenylcysteine carboxylmethyltransferase family protein [Chthoniobacterales bacterium]
MKSDSQLPIPPPVLAAVLIIAAGILASLVPLPAMSIPMHRMIGILFIALGVGVAGLAFATFKRAGTPVRPGANPTQFVISGPYRITRNPMYLGLLLFVVGCFFVTASPYFLVPPVLFFWMINSRQIPFEERLLVDRFGETYVAYCKRVRRWL